MQHGEIQVVTSTLILTEVLVHPYRRRDFALALQYQRILFGAANLRMLTPSKEIAVEAARLRAAHGLKTPDAIQLATALSEKATVFLTNDAGISSISGLQVVVLEKLLAIP
jgi:predicted nucleic acid-binding protein